MSPRMSCVLKWSSKRNKTTLWTSSSYCVLSPNLHLSVNNCTGGLQTFSCESTVRKEKDFFSFFFFFWLVDTVFTKEKAKTSLACCMKKIEQQQEKELSHPRRPARGSSQAWWLQSLSTRLAHLFGWRGDTLAHHTQFLNILSIWLTIMFSN